MFFRIFPVPPRLRAKSRVQDLKARLDWGEPALTILDVRDRSLFRHSHITGAMSMPMDELLDRATVSLRLTRDVYVYGETDDETAIAASLLRNAGYLNVSELRGGLAAWKAVGYPIDSRPTAALMN